MKQVLRPLDRLSLRTIFYLVPWNYLVALSTFLRVYEWFNVDGRGCCVHFLKRLLGIWIVSSSVLVSTSCIGRVTGFSGYDTIYFLGTGSVRRYDTSLTSGYFWLDAITYFFGFSATLSFIIDVCLELLVWLLSWLVPGSRKIQGISNQLEQFKKASVYSTIKEELKKETNGTTTANLALNIDRLSIGANDTIVE